MKCRGCLTWFVAIGAVGLLAGVLVFLNLGRYLDASTDPTEADAIVVLGGEGARFTRTRHALSLYSEGIADRVLFSGGSLLNAGIECTSTQLSVDAAEQLGLPAEAIVLADDAQSTYDEAVNFAKLVQEQEWQTLVIVTDRFHTRRSLQTMRALMPDVEIQMSAPADARFNATRWWSTEGGLTFAVNEFLKLGFYWVEYGIRPFG